MSIAESGPSSPIPGARQTTHRRCVATRDGAAPLGRKRVRGRFPRPRTRFLPAKGRGRRGPPHLGAGGAGHQGLLLADGEVDSRAMSAAPVLQFLLLAPVIGGSLYSVACLLAIARLKTRARRHPPGTPPDTAGDTGAIPAGASPAAGPWPPVTMLKPVYGLSRELAENLRSACLQDYPDLQIVLSAQRQDEPAPPRMEQIRRRPGAPRLDIALDGTGTVPNGKVRNLLVGPSAARHDLLVVSDSDVRLRPDYLKAIVAPFADPSVG